MSAAYGPASSCLPGDLTEKAFSGDLSELGWKGKFKYDDDEVVTLRVRRAHRSRHGTGSLAARATHIGLTNCSLTVRVISASHRNSWSKTRASLAWKSLILLSRALHKGPRFC